MIHKCTAHPNHTENGNGCLPAEAKRLALVTWAAVVFAKRIISPAAASMIIMIMEGI